MKKEAATIYKGVAHTSGRLGHRLVVDIGGASTELIIGREFDAKALVSLPMGCVTWLDHYFHDRQLTRQNFEQAILAAKSTLEPILQNIPPLVGMSVLARAVRFRHCKRSCWPKVSMRIITLAKLKRLQKQAMMASHLEELEIDGLTLERALVFPSGLSILIAIFESLNIESMTLAGGALREGLAYEIINGEMRQSNIRQRYDFQCATTLSG